MGAWSGFYQLPMTERLQRIAEATGLDAGDVEVLASLSALPHDAADVLIENATGSYPLPLGWVVGLSVDGHERVVPMAVEESSVVAAACKGAKMAAAGGGITTEAMPPVATGQIELRDVADEEAARAAFEAHRTDWMARLNDEIPSMVERGGGVRGLALRQLAPHHFCVHVDVDTRDAMGANLVNTLCEFISHDVAEALGARPGLRILTNLTLERLVTARCSLPLEAVGGADVAQAMVDANRFAVIDPFRAATHNKGIMNGIDPVLIATGNDWRAAEAGAHAYAALDGQYRALTSWEVADGRLNGSLCLPLAVGTVGGMTRIHPVARVALKALGNPSGPELARIAAAVGLVQNLAALRALASEGIQAGHMRLHARNDALTD